MADVKKDADLKIGDKDTLAKEAKTPALEKVQVIETRKVLYGYKVMDLKAGEIISVTPEFKKRLIIAKAARAV